MPLKKKKNPLCSICRFLELYAVTAAAPTDSAAGEESAEPIGAEKDRMIGEREMERDRKTEKKKEDEVHSYSKELTSFSGQRKWQVSPCLLVSIFVSLGTNISAAHQYVSCAELFFFFLLRDTADELRI